MNTRTLVSIVVAATVSAAATTAVMQMALSSSASAKAGGGSSSTTSHQIAHSFQKELSVDEQILSQVKTLRQHTETQLGKLNASTTSVEKNTAKIDKSTAGALVPLNQIAKDNALLVESYPDPGHYGVLLPQNSGLIQRTLNVVDSLCIDAQVSHYGNGGDPGDVGGC
jgi:hypothetical protein